MRKIFIGLAAMVLLAAPSACATPLSLQPSTYANQTKVDEQGGITAELGYKAFRLAVETGVKAGFIKGATATKAAAIDNTLYAALQTVENAYATGNATSINDALTQFNKTLASGYATIGGK